MAGDHDGRRRQLQRREGLRPHTRYPYFVFVDAAGTVRSRVAGEQTVDSLRRDALATLSSP